MRTSRRSRRRLAVLLALAAAASVWWQTRGPAIAVVVGLLSLCALWLLFRPRRRGAASHVNADGSPKRSYRTARAAQHAATEYERDFGGRMNPYRCSRGRHWHIGHPR